VPNVIFSIDQIEKLKNAKPVSDSDLDAAKKSAPKD